LTSEPFSTISDRTQDYRDVAELEDLHPKGRFLEGTQRTLGNPIHACDKGIEGLPPRRPSGWKSGR
jgi:hypothetical protein